MSSLTSQTSDAAVIGLYFKVFRSGRREDELSMLTRELGWEAFFQGYGTIRDYPLLSSPKRLHIKCETSFPGITQIVRGVDEIGELFRSSGPLNEFTIANCDSLPFFPPPIVLWGRICTLHSLLSRSLQSPTRRWQGGRECL